MAEPFECPECNAQLFGAAVCPHCGWRGVRARPAPPPRAPIQAATADEARAFMAEIRRRLGPAEAPLSRVAAPPGLGEPLSLTRAGVTVTCSRDPVCAGCGQRADDGELHDARLWHPACWRRYRSQPHRMGR